MFPLSWCVILVANSPRERDQDTKETAPPAPIPPPAWHEPKTFITMIVPFYILLTHLLVILLPKLLKIDLHVTSLFVVWVVSFSSPRYTMDLHVLSLLVLGHHFLIRFGKRYNSFYV